MSLRSSQALSNREQDEKPGCHLAVNEASSKSGLSSQAAGEESERKPRSPAISRPEDIVVE